MQRRPYKNRNTETGLICTNPNCDNISSKLRIVEDKIINALRDWLKEYTLNVNDYISKVDQDNVTSAENALKNLEKQLENQKKKIANVYDYFEDGTYSKEMFNERILMLDAKKNEIEENIKKQRNVIKEQYKRLQDKKEVIPKIENIIDVYPTLETAEEKNLLLKTVLKKVVYQKDKRALGKDADPTDFRLDIYPNVYHAS